MAVNKVKVANPKVVKIKPPKPPKVKKPTKKELQIKEKALATKLPLNYRLIYHESELYELREWIKCQDVIAVDTETMGLNVFTDEIVGMSLYAPGQGWYIPFKIDESVAGDKLKLGKIGYDYINEISITDTRDIIMDELISKYLIWHNYTFDAKVFKVNMGVDVGFLWDTLVGAKLLNENMSGRLKDIAPKWLGVPAETFSSLFGNKFTFNKVPILLNEDRSGCLAGYYAIYDTELTYRLWEFEMKYFNDPNYKNLRWLADTIELPILPIIVEAEMTGVEFDEEYMVNKVSPMIEKRLEESYKDCVDLLGEINFGSPKQLSNALYVDLKLPVVNKKKPNSTNEKTLKKLIKINPKLQRLIDYKKDKKLKTAFVDTLPQQVVNGIIHCTFNSIQAKTRRMSCSRPNLQQVPSKIGPLIRNAFKSRGGKVLVSLDFSGQELRVLAHMSGCSVMKNIFENDLDMHSTTAVGIYNRKYNQDVTYEYFEERRNGVGQYVDKDGNPHKDLSPDILDFIEEGKLFEKIRKVYAKTLNFAIVYGTTKYGLADTLEISEEEAQDLIDSFLLTYPGVARWMHNTKKVIDEQGFIESFHKGKRRLHEMVAEGGWKRSSAHRQGMNYQIQSTSAEMTKLAAIAIQPILKSLNAVILLFIHDEILIEAPNTISQEDIKRIQYAMCNVMKMVVEMKSDCEIGERWGQNMSGEELKALSEKYEDLQLKDRLENIENLGSDDKDESAEDDENEESEE